MDVDGENTSLCHFPHAIIITDYRTQYMNSVTPSQVTPFIVAPFTDLQGGDPENLIYLVLSEKLVYPIS